MTPIITVTLPLMTTILNFINALVMELAGCNHYPNARYNLTVIANITLSNRITEHINSPLKIELTVQHLPLWMNNPNQHYLQDDINNYTKDPHDHYNIITSNHHKSTPSTINHMLEYTNKIRYSINLIWQGISFDL